MQWLDEYNIGVSNIDRQHKKLTNTLNRLQDSLTTTYVDKQMAVTLKFMVSYTQHHFSEEEELMESIGYPDINQHKSQHKNLINEVRIILLKLKKREQINAKELIDFLITWLKDHIIEEDSKIGHYIRKLKNKGTPAKPFSFKLVKEKLIIKLKDLKIIYEKDLISEEEYSNKKKYLVNDFLYFQKIESKNILGQYIDFLDYSISEKLMTVNEYDAFKKELNENSDLNLILSKIKGTVQQMEYLKTLTENKILSPEKFKEYKDKLFTERT